MTLPVSPIYGTLMLAGILVSAWIWSRLVRRDARLFVVYLGALGGALLGAKALFLLIDGWRFAGQPDAWVQWATGKTVLGALLGGYAGVELAKKLARFPAPTGDWFALVAPIGIVLGRVGCLFHGCCLGRILEPHWFTIRDATGFCRWPAVPVEILFNLAALATFLLLRRAGRFKNQHFHLYLIGYGAFRFLHEFLRGESRLLGAFTGYHGAAMVVLLFGIGAFYRRAASNRPSPEISKSKSEASH
jgi:phosphatidylglycerol:prolipoprotein diacylglycerol transferase